MIVALAAGAAIGVWSEYVITSENYLRYKDSVESKTEDAAERIARNCSQIFLAGELITSCIKQALTSYEQKNAANQDLRAQIDMAFWAKWP